jgi:hypothetical protein
MSKTEWAPGPYTFDENSGTVYSRQHQIAFVAGGYEGSIANGCLLAAAPELYEALEELLDVLSEYVGWRNTAAHEPRETAAENKARAALAKARGNDV